ncbi:signal recognition particle 54 kDa protein 2-like [Macadamia integrifolia]|uniref:signal recognition particle 54 kDa protein 2-like n=1 Tax=Macadamia integrifolia TaxID=60698 RepID=UPI001C52F45B|nr:signal recognition particle 54 kDa protein 2-like [Macadamia integrifolia]
MVLAELGGSISRALQQMSNATIIDEKVLNECLNEITRALLQSDVQFKLVRDMQTNIKKIVNLDDLAAGHNKRKIIQQAIFNELCKMLDPGKPSFTPKKGKTSVIMFVGLQGFCSSRRGFSATGLSKSSKTTSHVEHLRWALQQVNITSESGKFERDLYDLLHTYGQIMLVLCRIIRN